MRQDTMPVFRLTDAELRSIRAGKMLTLHFDNGLLFGLAFDLTTRPVLHCPECKETFHSGHSLNGHMNGHRKMSPARRRAFMQNLVKARAGLRKKMRDKRREAKSNA